MTCVLPSSWILVCLIKSLIDCYANLSHTHGFMGLNSITGCTAMWVPLVRSIADDNLSWLVANVVMTCIVNWVISPIVHWSRRLDHVLNRILDRLLCEFFPCSRLHENRFHNWRQPVLWLVANIVMTRIVNWIDESDVCRSQWLDHVRARILFAWHWFLFCINSQDPWNVCPSLRSCLVTNRYQCHRPFLYIEMSSSSSSVFLTGAPSSAP